MRSRERYAGMPEARGHRPQVKYRPAIDTRDNEQRHAAIDVYSQRISHLSNQQSQPDLQRTHCARTH